MHFMHLMFSNFVVMRMNCLGFKVLKLGFPILSFKTVLRCMVLSAGKNLKEGLAALEEELVLLTDKLQEEAQCIPNISHPDVPIGGEDCSALRKMVF